jgi:hypothetical protein
MAEPVKPVFKTTFGSVWGLNDRVIADGDRSLPMTVTAFQFRLERSPIVECSYFHNGKSETAWMEEWRLSPYMQGPER